MSNFFNPFRSFKHYYRRTFSEFVGQYCKMLIGDISSELGLLDYLFIIPAITKGIVVLFNPYPNDSNLFLINGIFYILKYLATFPLLVVSLPFLFAYHKIARFIGKPIKELIENLEVLPFEPHARTWFLKKLGTAPDAVSFEAVVRLLPDNDIANVLVLFENTDIYYLNRQTKKLQKIDPTLSPNNYPAISNYLELDTGTEATFYSVFQDGLILKIEQAIGLTPLDYDPVTHRMSEETFVNTYYDPPRRSILRDNPLVVKMDTYSLLPVLVNLDSTKKRARMVLGLFWHPDMRPSYFIVPSKENKTALKALMHYEEFAAHKLDANHVVPHLNKLMENKDDYKEGEKEIRKVRIHTSLVLLNELPTSAQEAMRQIYKTIAAYADLVPTEEEFRLTEIMLKNTLWATPPRPLPATGEAYSDNNDLRLSIQA